MLTLALQAEVDESVRRHAGELDERDHAWKCVTVAADITVLGDTPNTGARITSHAAGGELLISEAASKAAGLKTGGMEGRLPTMKGRKQPVKVWVRTVAPKNPAA